jgi:hypothetical protein
MIFTPEIIGIFILNGIFFVFATIAFIVSLKIFTKWNFNTSTQLQYNLEKQTILTSTIIKYIFLVKLPLFLFFVFVLDKISNVLTGAMCAAGVVDATVYGTPLFILKIINLYIFALWLILHKIDISKEELPFTKLKFGFFLFAYLLFVAELVTETLMFTSIDPAKIVSCCGALYSSTSTSYISGLFEVDTKLLLSLFYGNFFMLVIFYWLKNRFAYGVFGVLFLIISIISLIVWFGTYIYELPTHHCPFCFLQKDYYYVGYLIYTTLFLGTFYAVATLFFTQKDYLKYSFIFLVLYTIIVSAYPISYYFRNGVWL